MAGIDWDQIESMQEEAQTDLSEVAQSLRDGGDTLDEGQARYLQLKANVALSILSINPPPTNPFGMYGLPAGGGDPEEQEAEVPA